MTQIRTFILEVMEEEVDLDLSSLLKAYYKHQTNQVMQPLPSTLS